MKPEPIAKVGGFHRLVGIRIERVDPASEVARWCVRQYFAELDARFDGGFDPSKAIPTDDEQLRPPRGACLVGTLDGEPVACGSVKTMEPGVGWLKRMWVAPAARGLGLGRRLLAALEEEAAALGITTLRLETNRLLPEAIQLYRTSGYEEVEAFNDDPYGDYWFEKRLVVR